MSYQAGCGAYTYNPSTPEAADICVCGQPILQSESQSSQGYTDSPHLEKRKQK